MKKELLLLEIYHLLETIKEQTGLMNKYHGKIPEIEIDMIRENVRRLYDQLNRLSKENIEQELPGYTDSNDLIAGLNHTPVPQKEKEPEAIYAEPVRAEPIPPVIQNISEEVIVKEAAQDKTRVARNATLFDDHSIVADRFEEMPTFYDRISEGQQNESIAMKLQKNPVEDLKKSIGINEKFSLINELFDGSLDDYNDTIEKLNGFKNRSEAMSFVENELSPKYRWNENSDAFLHLKNLLGRRFA
jgi:hypothetical protein